MSALVPHSSWSRRRWLITIALVFAAQLALVMVLGDRPWKRPKPAKAFRQALAERAVPPASPAWDDPTLFALANPRGFSGQAWMRVPPLAHHYYEWTDKTCWLEPKPDALGLELVQALRPAPNAKMLVEKPVPASFLPSGLEGAMPLPGRSLLHVEGEFSDRDLLAPPALPVLNFNGSLPPSVVQAVVDELGRVFSLSLVAESGNKTADQKALQIAKSLVFAELPSRVPGRSGLHHRFARLVFQWHTTPLSTAAVAAKP